MTAPQDYGLDFERAKAILAKYGHLSPGLTAQTLAEWLREAREKGLGQPPRLTGGFVMTAADPLLERILYDCRMSGGTLPITIVVKDAAEKARGLALLKGRRHNALISFRTEAETEAAIAAQCRAWRRAWRRTGAA